MIERQIATYLSFESLLPRRANSCGILLITMPNNMNYLVLYVKEPAMNYKQMTYVISFFFQSNSKSIYTSYNPTESKIVHYRKLHTNHQKTGISTDALNCEFI